ncbi:malate:quinone oxidoreductase, partial [Staphylococcus epidermidis]|uniref:malate:quinone oxidoreductase n=1 Tax=Staphylococcus epidermidis TaxID=1282 RepID=UPI001643103D
MNLQTNIHITQPNHKNILLLPPRIIPTSVPTILSKLTPNSHIHMFQTLQPPAIQTSNEPNNPPTTHPPLSQFNYTLQQPHPSIHIQKPKQINQQFQISKQFSPHLLKSPQIQNPKQFINPLPHITFL